MHFSPLHRLMALALLLSLGIGALFARAILTIRDEEWNYTRTNNTNLVQSIEQSLARTLDGLDRSLLGLAHALGQPEVMALPLGLRSQVLFDYSLRVPAVAAVRVSDVHGNIVLHGNGAPPVAVNIAAQDYFAVHRSGAQKGLYIGKPQDAQSAQNPQSAQNGDTKVLPLSRAYLDANGQFAGVVVLEIRLGSINEQFQALNLGPMSGANLFRTEGTIVARFPYQGADVGRTLAGTSNMLQMQASSKGVFVGRATLDGVERLYAFRHVGTYPLIVNIAQSTQTILAHWQHNAWLLGGFALALMVACVGLAGLFARELQHRQKVSARLQQAEYDLRTILDNLPSMVAYWEHQWCNRFANQAYQELFRVTPQVLNNMTLLELLGDAVYAKTIPYFEQALQGHRQLFERNMRNAQGVDRFTVVSYVPDINAAGVVRGVFVQITDITERKQMENALFEEKERMRLTLQSIGDAVLCTDAQARVTYLNPVAERMTGWQAFAAAGRHIDEVVPLQVAGSQPGAASPLCQALAHGSRVGPTRGVVLQRGDGVRFDVEESASPIADRHGQVTGAVMVLHDVTERAAMAERMARLAQYDALTDLPNRVLLQDRARQALAHAQRDGKNLGVLYLDLDGFKQVNDTLGHDVGDALLVQFARRLQSAMRASDTVSRQGGDEFVVLLPGIEDAAQACTVARKILAVTDAPFDLQGQSTLIGVSGGIALFAQHGETFEALARSADAAMYEAKRQGRGQFQLCGPQGTYTRVV
ncbi:MAG: diguanylate cyclase [Simplicispira sp.]|nr:diguanylate cyclase [Simplicispira sp.]